MVSALECDEKATVAGERFLLPEKRRFGMPVENLFLESFKFSYYSGKNLKE